MTDSVGRVMMDGGGYDDGCVWAGAVWRPPPGKRGVSLHAALVQRPGSCIRRLAGDRARQMRFTRFLRNASVTTAEMSEHAAARTARCVAGREVVAIQDTTELMLGGRRARADGFGPVGRGGATGGLLLHPVLAVEAATGALLGLVDATVWNREGGKAAARRGRATAAKESRRWLDGAARAGAVLAAAASITVVADRESDIYEQFVGRPANVHLLIRAAQDRRIEAAADQPALLYRLRRRLAGTGPAGADDPCGAGTQGAGGGTRGALLPGGAAQAPPRRGGRSAGHGAADAGRCARSVAAGGGRTDPLAAADHPRRRKPRRGSPGSRPLSSTLDHRRVLPHAENGGLRHRGGGNRRSAGDEQLRRRRHRRRRHGDATRPGPRRHDRAAPRRRLRSRRPADSRTLSAELEGKTARQKNPHAKQSLAFAAWTIGRLGGWDGYYGKPGPRVISRGLHDFQRIKYGSTLALENV